MATKTGRGEAWQSLLQRGVQRGIDTAADLSGALSEKLSAAGA